MKKIKYILKYLLAFIIIICTYMILMTFSSMIPSSLLQKNVKESSETLFNDNEKVFFNLGYKYESIFTFTDALMINTAYSIDSSTPIKSSMLARKDFIPSQTKVEHIDSQYNLGITAKYRNPKTGDIYQTKELYGLMHGEKIEESFEYARYWHGYLVILRPLLVFFSYSSIRIIFFILTLVLMITMLILISKKINKITALIYALGFFCVSILIVTQSINEILIFILTFISTILLLLKKQKKDMFMFFFILGSVTNFIDLLTAPIITLGIVGTTYFLLLQKENHNISIKETNKQIIIIGIAWALGYGLTWGAKWIITQVFFDRNLIAQAIEQALYRIKLPTNANGNIKYTLWDVINKNLHSLSLYVVFFIMIIGMISIVINLIKKYDKDINFKNNLKECIPYICMSLLPIAWYMILKQHSLIHSFFTYRIFVISIINIFIIIKTLFQINDKEINSIETEKEK